MSTEKPIDPNNEIPSEKSTNPIWIIFWLVALAIFFAVIVIPLRPKMMVSSPKNKARGDVNAIAMAVNTFYADLGRLPGTNHFLEGNAILMNELQGTSQARYNTNQTIYIETETSHLQPDQARDFLDPWGEPYRVYLDVGLAPDAKAYDGKVDIDFSSGIQTYLTRCIALSTGNNRTFGDADDIYNVKQF